MTLSRNKHQTSHDKWSQNLEKLVFSFKYNVFIDLIRVGWFENIIVGRGSETSMLSLNSDASVL